MIPTMISQRIKKRDQGAGLPIGGATAPEEGGTGSELGWRRRRPNRHIELDQKGVPLGTHVPHAVLHWQRCPHGILLGQVVVGQTKIGRAKASDAIPKKRAKQSIKAAISFTILYNP